MFVIKVLNVPDKALGTIIRRLGTYRKDTQIEYYEEATSEEAAAPRKYTRTSGATKMTLTGKAAQIGSNRETVLLIFQKLESIHGIGSISRNTYRQAIKEQSSVPPAIITQLLHDGFLSYL